MAAEHCSTSKENIFALTHNALSVELLEDGYYCALRFSEEQEMGYNSHPLYRAMAGTSASVCLRFHTLTDVTVHLRRYSQSLLPKKGEQVIDFASLYPRQLDLSETIDLLYEGKDMIHLPLQSDQISIEKGNMVSLYLPMHHRVGFCIEGDAQPIEKKEKTLLCIGDSIVQGVGIHHPSLALCERLSSLKGVQVINQGLAGALVNSRLIQKLDIPIHGILVALGTNDWSIRENLADLRGEMFALLGRIRKFYPSVPVTVLTPLWRADIQHTQKMGSFAEMQKTIEYATYCFPHIRVANGLSLSLRDAYDDGFIHPDEKGIRFLAKGLAAQLP